MFRINKEPKTQLEGDLKVVNTVERLRYYSTTNEDYGKIKQYFDSINRQYYTFQLKRDLPLRVIIKRLPKETDPEEIKEDLLELEYPVRSVKKLRQRMIKFLNSKYLH